MNNIIFRKDILNPCTGCGVCSVVCPQKCIDIHLNEEGFFMPFVDEQSCVKCGQCADVCYKFFNISNLDDGKEIEDCKVYAAILRDAEQLKSVTSGGVASELSRYYFAHGYDVIGVIMDPQKDYCEHIIASCTRDLERMKSSKYVQTYTQKAFSEIQLNRKTLLIGSPCQIYGVRKYIQKHGFEDNFLLVDLFCRGVPCVNLWRKYREYLRTNHGLGGLISCNFRSKKIGWHRFSITASDGTGNEYSNTVYYDIFYSFYLKNSCLRESCYSCEFRHNRIFSDIRLGDFWGSKYYSHDEGVSIVSIYTQRGQEIWNKISGNFISEENDPKELKLSQRFNRLPIPSYRNDLLVDLSTNAPLEAIHIKHGLDKLEFYKGDNK